MKPGAYADPHTPSARGWRQRATRASVRDACFLDGQEGKREASAWVAPCSDTPEAGVRGRNAHGHAPGGLATPVCPRPRCLLVAGRSSPPGLPRWREEPCSVPEPSHNNHPCAPQAAEAPADRCGPPSALVASTPAAAGGFASGAPCRLHTPANRGGGDGDMFSLAPRKHAPREAVQDKITHMGAHRSPPHAPTCLSPSSR